MTTQKIRESAEKIIVEFNKTLKAFEKSNNVPI